MCAQAVPETISYERRGEFLRCPWHGWEFDIKTGQSYFDPTAVRVRRYPVEVAAGEQLLATPAEGRQPGPYLAETYPIVVEEQYHPGLDRGIDPWLQGRGGRQG